MTLKYNPRWKTLHSKVAHKNPWYQVYCNKVLRPDGVEGKYYVMNTPGASVFVVAVNTREEVCMIQIDRYPVAGASWEIPGGNSEGQPVLSAARRELEEETGYKARKWVKAGKWLPMNGVCPEVAHVYIAKDLYPAAKKKDSRGEGIRQVVFMPVSKALKMAFSGKIIDGQTLAGFFLAGEKLGWFGNKK
jgi:8-oxo-dGDP phosphatase